MSRIAERLWCIGSGLRMALLICLALLFANDAKADETKPPSEAPTWAPNETPGDLAHYTVPQLAAIVRLRSDKKVLHRSSEALEVLLNKWNPIGESEKNVVKLLGSPDQESSPAHERFNKELIYKFAFNGRWAFLMLGGKVIGTDHMIY